MAGDIGSGFPCKNCGKLITVFVQALPVLPDPIKLTCPFCDHADTYEKDAIRNILNYKNR